MAITPAFLRPFERFLRTETRAGTLLLLATVAALAIASSPWSAAWSALWATPLSIRAGAHVLEMPALAWINDLLMAAFFLLVGLEIKREVVVGELNTTRKAALPLVAALGGMVVPALVYTAIAGRVAPAGWGVPMATDIAFSLGLARLLGARVPPALLVFLTAFAIADDLGAIVVIALFYGHAPALVPLAVAGALVAVLFGMNRAGVRSVTPYFLVGLPLWAAVHASGIHATMAGVIVGLSIPAAGTDAREAIARADAVIDRGGDTESALEEIEHHVDEAQSPLANLEHAMHPYVAYAILPLFALANAGIDLRGLPLALDPVTLGIALGLLVGKPIGILAGSGAAVAAGIAELPAGVGWTHLAGAAVLGGVGFTMSLFVASLAFHGDPALHVQAKVGILAGSALSGMFGLALLRAASRQPAV